jgi:phospholipid/cholesterol/gamma-HCH transport system ATP-binding protein
MPLAEPVTPSPPVSVAVPHPEVVAEHVCKAFGEHIVLDDISLTIRSGEIVAIVGGSGSGKTVLLNHLTGLLWPDSGRILVADHSALPGPASPPLVDLAAITDEHLDQIRLHWSVVFQHNALFTGTVFENIALWLREHTRLHEAEINWRVQQSLQAVALDPEDVWQKDRETLSGGMAKRVAIARAIATEPVVIFYDEPTTGLDPVVGGHIHELIWSTHHRPPLNERPGAARTTVIVTHDKELLRRLAPRVVMLFEGRICFDGPYEFFTRSDNPTAHQYLQAMPVLHARPNPDHWPGR